MRPRGAARGRAPAHCLADTTVIVAIVVACTLVALAYIRTPPGQAPPGLLQSPAPTPNTWWQAEYERMERAGRCDDHPSVLAFDAALKVRMLTLLPAARAQAYPSECTAHLCETVDDDPDPPKARRRQAEAYVECRWGKQHTHLL